MPPHRLDLLLRIAGLPRERRSAAAIGKTGPVIVTHQGDVHPLRGDRDAAEDVLREFEQSPRRGQVLH